MTDEQKSNYKVQSK